MFLSKKQCRIVSAYLFLIDSIDTKNDSDFNHLGVQLFCNEVIIFRPFLYYRRKKIHLKRFGFFFCLFANCPDSEFENSFITKI